MKSILVAGALSALASSAPAQARRPPATVSVIVDKLSFGPIPALHVGDSILWVNRDLFRHSATSAGHFDIDLPVGARRRMVMTKAGTFAFTCKYHPGMKGVITVAP